MKKISIILAVFLGLGQTVSAQYGYDFSQQPTRGTYGFGGVNLSYDPFEASAWSLSFFNVSSDIRNDKLFYQYSFTFDKNFEDEEYGRDYFNLTFGQMFPVKWIKPFWSLGYGMKTDIYRTKREDKKWYQGKYKHSYKDWGFGISGNIGLAQIYDIGDRVEIGVMLKEEFYALTKSGFTHFTVASLSLTIKIF